MSNEQSLPRWNLSDLFPDNKSAENAILKIKNSVESFRTKYSDKIKGIAPDNLLAATKEFEGIIDTFQRLSSYTYLQYVTKTTTPEKVSFYTKVSEELSELYSKIAFFGLEINSLEDAEFNTITSHPSLERYKPFYINSRRFKPYQLPKPVEEVLLKKSVTARKGWIDLFTKISCALKFEVKGDKINMAEVMHLLSSKEESERKDASKVLGKTLGDNIEVFASIINNIMKDKAIDDKERGFAHPISEMNIENHVEDEVIDCLIESVKQGYKDTSHRYYKIKSQLMGKTKLKYWDRNAPLPEAYSKSKKYTYEEARAITLKSYEAFSPEMAKIGQKFFDGPWIDVPPEDGKDSGAFAHPATTSAHPYLMLNFMGNVRDVMTLAHELGHGVHQYLARGQGPLMCDTPLTIAETASVFGEELVFQEIFQSQTEKNDKISVLCSKIEDSINTIIRQIAFCNFERLIHDKRAEGSLSVQNLCEIWLEVQKESLGKHVEFEDEYKYYWSYIPHFIHTPFYVYSYAFGNCLVNGLYAVYKEGSVDNFQSKYIEALAAGGSKHHKNLLSPFNIDISNKTFWTKGVDVLRSRITALENLI